MTTLDWLIIGFMVASATCGIVIWEFCWSVAHWFERRTVTTDADYDNAGI